MSGLKFVWVVELTHIDATTVTFDSQQHAAKLTIPRAEWESMGRPGMVEFSPSHWSPL